MLLSNVHVAKNDLPDGGLRRGTEERVPDRVERDECLGQHGRAWPDRCDRIPLRRLRCERRVTRRRSSDEAYRNLRNDSFSLLGDRLTEL